MKFERLINFLCIQNICFCFTAVCAVYINFTLASFSMRPRQFHCTKCFGNKTFTCFETRTQNMYSMQRMNWWKHGCKYTDGHTTMKTNNFNLKEVRSNMKMNLFRINVKWVILSLNFTSKLNCHKKWSVWDCQYSCLNVEFQSDSKVEYQYYGKFIDFMFKFSNCRELISFGWAMSLSFAITELISPRIPM